MDDDQKQLVRLDSKRRRILLSGEFDYEFGIDFVEYFLELDNSFGEIEIVLMASPGGCWDTAEALIDIVTSSKNMITTYCVGTNSSSAAMLALAGDRRVISPRGRLMFHNITVDLNETYEKLINFTELVKKELDEFHLYISERSNKPPKFFAESLARGDFYVSAQSAVDLGLAHSIGVPNV